MPSPSQDFGYARERQAARFLEERGYEIVEKNWRGAGGEVDLIAWDGELLCFVEVRARSRADFGLPMETVDHAKQRKLVRAATAYLMRFPPAAPPMARFDVVSIVFTDPPEVTLVKNAFEASG